MPPYRYCPKRWFTPAEAWIAVYTCLKQGRRWRARKIIAARPDLPINARQGELLRLCMDNQDTKTISCLLEQSSLELNIKNCMGEVPFLYSFEHWCPEQVWTMFMRDSRINIHDVLPDSGGNTFLQLYIGSYCTRDIMFDVLEEVGGMTAFDILKSYNDAHFNALALAIKTCDYKAIKRMIKHMPDGTGHGYFLNGNTYLHEYCLYARDKTIIPQLIAVGANPLFRSPKTNLTAWEACANRAALGLTETSLVHLMYRWEQWASFLQEIIFLPQDILNSIQRLLFLDTE